MINKIEEDIWKLSLSSNIYFLEWEKKIIIDTGDRADQKLVKTFLSKVVDFSEVEIVIFTHLHYDHVGNFDIFKKAKYYASSKSIESFNNDPAGTVLKEDIAEKLKSIHMSEIPDKLLGLEIISTPGHTGGSICLWSPKYEILFSGDTLFFNKNIGRVDLPTSEPTEMRQTLIKLLGYNFKKLCPGHD